MYDEPAIEQGTTEEVVQEAVEITAPVRRRPMALIVSAVAVMAAAAVFAVLAFARKDTAGVGGSIAATVSDSFDFRVFDSLAANAGAKNLMVSPLSLSQALAMAYNGAAGTTKADMAKTLGVTQSDLAVYNRENAAKVHALLASDPSVSLNVANSLWANKGFSLDQSYVSRTQSGYGAELASLDFSSPSTLNTINGWVSRNTQGKIPSILDHTSASDRLYLINAVYFKGAWADRFYESSTTNRPFTTGRGSVSSVPTMAQTTDYPYYETSGFQMVSLPYGNGSIRMDIILPKGSGGIASLSSSLHADAWASLESKLSSKSVQLYLPKFTSDYSVDLGETLKGLGMSVAFDRDRADFSGMTGSRGLAISKVLQKTYIKLDEKGTEAAAVTFVGLTSSSVLMNPPKPVVMDVNHPFVYVIRDSTSGTIMFMGIMNDPAA